jgi:hypothetical protein
MKTSPRLGIVPLAKAPAQLNLKPMWGDAAYRGTVAESGGPVKGGEYERLANALADFNDD